MGLILGIVFAIAVLGLIIGLAVKFGRTGIITTTTSTSAPLPESAPTLGPRAVKKKRNPKSPAVQSRTTSSAVVEPAPDPTEPPVTPAPPPLPSSGPVPVGDDLRVTIGGDLKEVQVLEPYYPDGVSVVLPRGYKGLPSDRYFAILPEAYNRAGFVSQPFFENMDIGRDLPVIESLGSHSAPFPYPNDLNAGTFWIFGCLKISSGWACFLHGENHALGSAPPTFKSQLISTSKDLKTWSRPQPIVTVPPFDGREGWYGAGDSCFVFDDATNEFRGYFFEAQSGMGVCRSLDKDAAPGTWQLYNGPGQWTDALKSSSYKRLPINAGNPHVLYHKGRNNWIMVAGEWGQAAITFALSADGYEWQNILRVPFQAAPNSTPLYPHIVSKEGGTVFVEQKARLYWSDTAGPRRMMSCDITIV